MGLLSDTLICAVLIFELWWLPENCGFGPYLSGSSLTMMVLPPTNGNGMAKWLDGWRTHRLRVCITTRINDREFGITFVSRYSPFRNKLASPWLPCRGWYFHIQLALCMINRLAISLAGEVEWGFNGWRAAQLPQQPEKLNNVLCLLLRRNVYRVDSPK